jgi:hypothetical protein
MMSVPAQTAVTSQIGGYVQRQASTLRKYHTVWNTQQ